VVVLGPWYDRWCYKDVARLLRQAGHDVFTPAHSYLGERRQYAGDNVILESRIRDGCGCIEAEKLDDIILGCMVTAGWLLLL